MESQQPQFVNSESARNQLQELGIAATEYDAKLFTAIYYNDTQHLSFLIAEGANVNWADNYGRTPLLEAAYSGHTECVEMFIAEGADVNTADINGETPLHWAVKKGRTECVELLLEAGADVNKKDMYGHTPLYTAISWNQISCGQLLLASPGINVVMELQNMGITADKYDSKLFDAVRNNYPLLANLLIAAGADVNKRDMYGRTPLDYTKYHEYRFFNHYDSKLRNAINYNDTLVLHLLIAKGEDINEVDSDGNSLLHVALHYDHAECVRLLLTAPGIDINKANRFGETPLHWAAKNGRTACVRWLLAAPGIDVNKGDKDGATPLHLATESGHSECVRLLQSAGAGVNSTHEKSF